MFFIADHSWLQLVKSVLICCVCLRCLCVASYKAITQESVAVWAPLLGVEFWAADRGIKCFFLRLPIGQYGPVSQLSRSEESCTGPFNWGEAHCAGEKVKRKIGPFLRKSLKNQTRKRTQQKGRSPPRQPGTPWPGSQVHGPTRKQTQQARDFTNKS